MLDKRRRQYLEAMGISTWSAREAAQPVVERPVAEEPPAETSVTSEGAPRESSPPAPETSAPESCEPSVDAAGIKLGPGRDGILLVCAGDDEPASRLASDITRVLGAVPVWAWPEAGSGAVSIDSAVEENLFTEVAVFGAALAASLFPGEVPAKVGSASVVQLPSLAEIREQGSARRTLWNALCRAGVVNCGQR
jgi:hypothetical protein